MNLTFITGNAGKFAEVQALLPNVTIEQLDIDLDEIQEVDPKKVIEHKLQQAFVHHSGPMLVEDTSLYFDCLQGLPGPFIKWFLKKLGPAGLAELTAKMDNNRATAKTYLGYATSPTNVHFFEGEFAGQIVEPRGDHGFGWDPVFLPEGSQQTFAELTQDQKHEFSMRRKAVEQLAAFLQSGE